MSIVLPLFGVAAMGNVTLENKCHICYPFLPLLGELSRVKVPLRLLPLVIPYSGTLSYDMRLVLALRFLHKYMSIVLPLFVTTFGVAVRGKATLKMLTLVSPYSRKPKVRYVSDFNFGSFTSINANFVTPFLPFWGCF